jgi:hypothetical protein
MPNSRPEHPTPFGEPLHAGSCLSIKQINLPSGDPPTTRFVDGYVTPLPKRHLAAYRRMAQQASKTWREHGALSYKEYIGDDPKCTSIDSGEWFIRIGGSAKHSCRSAQSRDQG